MYSLVRIYLLLVKNYHQRRSNMSLIAVTSNDSDDGSCTPIIIGDLLASTNFGRKNVPLPTFYDGVKDILPKHSVYLPSGLLQKVYIIKDDIVVALAGSVHEMIQILKEIKNYFKYKESTVENIRDLVYNYIVPLGCRESLFCIVLMERDAEMSSDAKVQIFTADFGKGKWLSEQTKLHGIIKAAGLGAEKFIEIIDRFDDDTAYTSQDDKHEVAAVVMGHVALVGKLIQTELVTLETISEFWGVNYEIVFYDVNKFKKLNDLTLVLANAYIDLDTHETKLGITHVFHNKYYEDLLIITVIMLIEKRINHYRIPPIYTSDFNVDLDYLPLENFTLHTTQIGLTIMFKFSNGNLYNYYSSLYSKPPYKNGKPSVELEVFENGDYRFYLDSKFTKIVFEAALQSQGIK